jgi:hypothetical protein
VNHASATTLRSTKSPEPLLHLQGCPVPLKPISSPSRDISPRISLSLSSPTTPISEATAFLSLQELSLSLVPDDTTLRSSSLPLSTRPQEHQASRSSSLPTNIIIQKAPLPNLAAPPKRSPPVSTMDREPCVGTRTISNTKLCQQTGASRLPLTPLRSNPPSSTATNTTRSPSPPSQQQQ